MKNEDILILEQGLGLVDAPEMDPNFNYAVSASLQEAKRVTANIRKAMEPSADFAKYEKVVQKLREKYALKDSEGKPMFVEKQAKGFSYKEYIIPDIDKPDNKFSKALKKISEENADIIKKREDQFEYLKQENKEFKPILVERATLPKGLTRAAMDAVFMIIDNE